MTNPDPSYRRATPWIVFGLLTIVVLFGGLIGWAAFSSISGAVIASGVVTVETKVKTVQHLDGGIVRKILVENGDEVKSGDLLIRLDDTNIKANLAIINSHLSELKASMARLEAERDHLPEIHFPRELFENVADPSIARIIAGQKSLFEARKTSMNGQVRLLRQKILQLRDQIKGLEAQQVSKKQQSKLIRQEIESIRPLYKKGHITRKRMLELERTAVQLDGEYGMHIGDIARVRSAIGETELEILQLDKAFQEKIQTELRESQAKLIELEERKFALDEKLRRIDIRAPRAGYVHNLAVHTIGGVVSPAAAILQIIPEEDRLIIEARVKPTDIDQISIGQKAIVHFSAFSSRTTPEMNGKVIKVSADSIVDKASGISYFVVIIEVPDSETAKLGKNKLLPGMPAEAFIRTRNRTAISYLLKPLMDNLNRAFREE
jgi:HlyD family secretion protein